MYKSVISLNIFPTPLPRGTHENKQLFFKWIKIKT